MRSPAASWRRLDETADATARGTFERGLGGRIAAITPGPKPSALLFVAPGGVVKLRSEDRVPDRHEELKRVAFTGCARELVQKLIARTTARNEVEDVFDPQRSGPVPGDGPRNDVVDRDVKPGLVVVKQAPTAVGTGTAADPEYRRAVTVAAGSIALGGTPEGLAASVRVSVEGCRFLFQVPAALYIDSGITSPQVGVGDSPRSLGSARPSVSQGVAHHRRSSGTRTVDRGREPACGKVGSRRAPLRRRTG